MKVFVDDINLHAWVKSREVLRAVPRVVCKLKKVMHKTRLQLSLTEGGKEGRCKLIASNKHLESTLCGMCEESQTVWNVWELTSGIEPKRRGKKEKGKLVKCIQRIAFIWKTKELRKPYMRAGTSKVLRMGVVRSVWGSKA